MVRIEQGVPAGLSGEGRRWLDGQARRLAALRAALPAGLSLDLTPESLVLLEPLVVRKLGGGREREFRDGVIGYAGEVLLRVGGGWWGYDMRPVVEFDPALRLDPVAPGDLVELAVRRRDGAVFEETISEIAAVVERLRAFNRGWEPTRLATPADEIGAADAAGDLAEDIADDLAWWLRRQEVAFQEWVAGLGGGARVWDRSPRSVETLERILLGQLPAGSVRAADDGNPVVQAAAWYVGEAMIRNGGGRWAFTPGVPRADDLVTGRPYVAPAAAGKSVAVPGVIVANLLIRQEAGYLVARFRRYLDQ
ncbi:hypothetical protein KZZ52_29650 [Dactylosporangium sp. AC04546]|uniref:hypothetical protein n=1 Tax=Dactylosporangium sp. AC04546 TaxID=2862460 RepID=UPI001EDD5046|nr:hypothetical protein [Dactylosporangium sp. AC04546]WVK78163.1 hypothetical protein KZZ52_29650 [Dactylosporangium sp. AC04546]